MIMMVNVTRLGMIPMSTITAVKSKGIPEPSAGPFKSDSNSPEGSRIWFPNRMNNVPLSYFSGTTEK